ADPYGVARHHLIPLAVHLALGAPHGSAPRAVQAAHCHQPVLVLCVGIDVQDRLAGLRVVLDLRGSHDRRNAPSIAAAIRSTVRSMTSSHWSFAFPRTMIDGSSPVGSRIATMSFSPLGLRTVPGSSFCVSRT